jgi:ParB/RepB/Spo0J family partition protein
MLAREAAAAETNRARNGVTRWQKSVPRSAADSAPSFRTPPPPSRRRPRTARSRSTPDLAAPEQVPAAHAHGRRAHRGSRALDQSERHHPADRRRKVEQGYEIIAGERRWRAAQRAGLLKVPVVVRDIPGGSTARVALIENIQREDLNPIEEAWPYRRLSDEFHLTQEQIADAVGKIARRSRTTCACSAFRRRSATSVASNALSMGHARALLALADEAAQLRVARDVVSRSLSVRETEALVKKAASTEVEKPEKDADVHTRAAEDKLRLALGTSRPHQRAAARRQDRNRVRERRRACTAVRALW